MIPQRSIGDRRVSAIGLGGASLTFDPAVSDAAAEEVIETALASGITFIDTAAVYTLSDGISDNEKLIARVLARSDSSDVFVATKGGHYRVDGTWPIDGRPDSIVANCEASLRTLGVSELDLYFLHWPDPDVPFEESVGAIEELRVAGKVRRTGVSNVDLAQFEVARSITPLSAVENPFSPFALSSRTLIAECEKFGVAFTNYSPLGGPNRPVGLATALPRTGRRAADLDISLESLVLAWELAISSAVIPITGSTRVASLLDSVSATELVLEDAVFELIDAEVEAFRLSTANDR